MKKEIKKTFLLFITCIVFFNYPVFPQKKVAKPDRINVAIYPYLPRPQQFKNVLSRAWDNLGTGVPINYIDWDCYETDPPNSLDIFVFDGMYYKYFLAKNYLKQIPISSVNDWMGFMNYAWDAVRTSSTTVSAIPYLGCSNVYFYRKSDNVLAGLRGNGLDSFYSVIGNSPSPGNPQPPLRQGLLMDLSGSTTDAALYLMTQMNLYNNYSQNPFLPSLNQLDNNVLNHLRLYTRMAGPAQATFNDTTDQRIAWFTQGYGRSLVGITENLCSFPSTYLDSVGFKLLPTADSWLPITEEFFVDMAAVNSNISIDKYPYALQLINLMTSRNIMYASMVPQIQGQNPQFLIPVRGRVLADLMGIHPLYINMASMLLNYYSQPFIIGPQSRTWLAMTKTGIKQAILNMTDQGNKKVLKAPPSKEKLGRFNSKKIKE